MEVFEKIIAILKLPLRFIFTIAFILGLILFLPQKILNKLMVTEFVNDYGKYLGILFLISSGYLLVSFIIWSYRRITLYRADKVFQKNINSVLCNLSLPDIYLLREFILQGKDVIEVPYENTEFISLYNKNILNIASNNLRSYIFGSFVTVTINPMVKKYVTTDLLKLPNGEPSQSELNDIKNHRPEFLTSLNYVNNLIKGIGRFC
jgi:hypothetical protein